MDLIRVINSRARHAIDDDRNGYEVVVANRQNVFDRGLIDDEENALCLKVAVAKPVLTEQFGAGLLEVLPVAGVV